MNKTTLRLSALATAAGFTLTSTAHAEAVSEAAATWHAQSLGQALAYTAIFALAGTALAIVGYKLFDKFTPGDLHREIVENHNVAAAIVAGSVILGVSLIIMAAIMG